LTTGLSIQVVSSEGGDRLLVSDVDVTDRLRDREVDRGVSLVASVPGVRSALVRLQREIGAAGSIVMVGRDIGTVVLPHAGTKVFLTASVHTRARRRYREIENLGRAPDFRRLVDEIQRRDKIDSERADSPLRPADDALVLETDALSVHEVVERILLRAGNS
jgi:cytidylate kinase